MSVQQCSCQTLAGHKGQEGNNEPFRIHAQLDMRTCRTIPVTALPTTTVWAGSVSGPVCAFVVWLSELCWRYLDMFQLCVKAMCQAEFVKRLNEVSHCIAPRPH